MLAHPYSSTVLGAFVARASVRRLLLTNIPHAQLLVSGRCDQQITGRIPGKRLHDVAMGQFQSRLPSGDVPQLDGKVTRGGGENVLGGRVEKDLPDFPARPSDPDLGVKIPPCSVEDSCSVCMSLPRMPRQLAHWCNVCRLFSIGEESEVLRHLPYKDFAVVGSGGDNMVVEGVPGRSKNTTSAQDIRHVPSLAVER